MNEIVNMLLSNEKARMISVLAIGGTKAQALDPAVKFFSNMNLELANKLAEEIFHSITDKEIEAAKNIFKILKR